MGKKLTDAQLRDLVEKKKTGNIKGLVNPSNQDKIQGKFTLDEAFNVQFELKP